MSTCKYSLKCTLRSPARETLRDFRGRTLVYPDLAACRRDKRELCAGGEFHHV